MAPDDGFECLSPLGQEQVHVRFTGRLGNQAVVWDATLMTLAAWSRAQKPGAPATARQFIEIAAPRAGVGSLTVGLAVPVIDLPTVRKTVIMVRNYKRLRPGRQEYGEPVSVASY